MTGPPPPPPGSGAPPPPPPWGQQPIGQPGPEGWHAPASWHPGPVQPPRGVNPDGRPRGLPPATWLTVLCIGLAVFTLAAVFVVRSAVETITRGEDLVAPATATMHLESGAWRVYLENRSIGVPQVVIRGADGQVALQRQPFGTTETLSIGGRSYRAVQRFDIERAGDYAVLVEGEGRIRIGRPITHVVSEWPWMLAGALSLPVIVIGIVFTAISIRNRGRARRYQATREQQGPAPLG